MSIDPNGARRGMGLVLILAGVYNLVWGGFVVLFPQFGFELLGLDPPRYPSIWRCVGMIVGVYGIGYLIASRDPIRHWPIVLVGLLGKILGPVGFAFAAASGELPWPMGLTILTNDLVWWAPFGWILWAAASAHMALPDGGERLTLGAALEHARDQQGRSLEQLSQEGPVLILFLRHAGCIFCREALADLARHRSSIEAQGVRMALVHMGEEASLRGLAERFALGDVSRISDPGGEIYRAFELERGTLGQLFGPIVWWRGLLAMLKGHRIGALEGDGFQMPGAFVVHRGAVIRAYRHHTAADRPDYVGLACPVA